MLEVIGVFFRAFVSAAVPILKTGGILSIATLLYTSLYLSQCCTDYYSEFRIYIRDARYVKDLDKTKGLTATL